MSSQTAWSGEVHGLSYYLFSLSSMSTKEALELHGAPSLLELSVVYLRSALPRVVPQGEWLCEALESAWCGSMNNDACDCHTSGLHGNGHLGNLVEWGKLLPTSCALSKRARFSHILISLIILLLGDRLRLKDQMQRPGTAPWRLVTHLQRDRWAPVCRMS